MPRLYGTLFLALTLLALTPGCTVRMRQPGEAERQALVNHITGLTRTILDAAERVDADSAFVYHSAAQDAIFLIDGTRYTRRELTDAYRTIYAGVERQEIDFGAPTATVVSEDVVIVASTGAFTTHMKSGSTFSRNVAWSYVWVYSDEAWEIRHAHQSFPRPE